MKTTELLSKVRSLTADVKAFDFQVKQDDAQIGTGMFDLVESETHKLEMAIMELLYTLEARKVDVFDTEPDTTAEDEYNRVVREGLS